MNLHDAANANDLERIRLLVEQGADKDKVIRVGYTPLYHASINGHVEVVQYLAEQGAMLDKANDLGNRCYKSWSS